MMNIRGLVGWSVTVGIAVSLSACAVSGIEGSRHTLYESVGDLSTASSAIVVGTVGEQELVEADMPNTVSTFTVEKALALDSLGADLEGGRSPFTSGQVIEIRQLGSGGMSSTPAPLLQKDGTYLLFITPTMLAGESEARQFYITGGNAGLYKEDGKVFVRIVIDSGDSLPAQLSLSDFG